MMELAARQLSKQFLRRGGRSNILMAVHPCDFSLSKGEFVVLRGRSGSGKSTFLNLICGLLAPTSGTVCYDDTDIYALDDVERSKFRNRYIGCIPQGAGALFSLTVQENILLPLSLYDGVSGEAKQEANRLMEILQIADLADSLPKELSGGELRRMAIARALVGKPEVLLADEPTGDLDDENTRIVVELLREAATAGAAVLMVSHESGVLEMADRVLRMDGGVLSGEGAVGPGGAAGHSVLETGGFL